MTKLKIPQRGIIVAVNDDGVIGKDGAIPWRYPGDLRRFARVTAGSTVIMGRKTWDSIPEKFRPLKGRHNVVVSASTWGASPAIYPPSVGVVPSIRMAVDLAPSDRPIWFIGGARIYAEALAFADVIDVTYVPDKVEGEDLVRFPFEATRWEEWDEGPRITHEDEPALKRRIYTRRAAR